MKYRIWKVLLFIIGGLILPTLIGIFLIQTIEYTEEEIIESAKEYWMNFSDNIFSTLYKLYFLSFILYPQLVSKKHRENIYLNLLWFISFYIGTCLVYLMI